MPSIIEYLIQLLSFVSIYIGANHNSTKGCGGYNPLEGIAARISVFYNNTFILLYVLRWQVGASPHSPPKSATAESLNILIHTCMHTCSVVYCVHVLYADFNRVYIKLQTDH